LLVRTSGWTLPKEAATVSRRDDSRELHVFDEFLVDGHRKLNLLYPLHSFVPNYEFMHPRRQFELPSLMNLEIGFAGSAISAC